MSRPHGWSRLSVRNWRVRTKLAAVLFVPSLAFVGVGGIEMFSALRTMQTLQAYADRVALGREVTGLIHPLQQERDRVAGALAEARRGANSGAQSEQFEAATESDRRTVDRAVAVYLAAVGSVSDRLGGTFAIRVEAADEALADLPRLRRAAAEGQLRNDAIFDAYSRLIAALIRVLPDSAGAGDDATVEQQVRGLFNLVQTKELQSQVRGRLEAIAQVGSFSLGHYQAFADLRARRTAALEGFRAEADATQLARYEGVVKGPAVVAATRLERAAADRSRSARLGFDAEQWWLASTAQIELLRTAERQFVDAAIGTTAGFQSAAVERAQRLGILVAAIVCAALLTSFVIGRSMAESLRRLRTQALIVANHNLPDAIRRLSTAAPTELAADLPAAGTPAVLTGSADEIGDVADAFDQVHRSAVRLAVEQATLRRDISAMFVNLARRSQILVEGQLRVLDELEANEQDPDRLARLFALDHLTTRLRRNDENLLVLASGESQRMWREPVPLSRVLLGALAETEQYQRVRVAGPEDVLVVGHAVPDLMHLLAELVDNATAFSPPASSVELTAEVMGGGAAGAVLTVNDEGMGMTPAMLAEANARLAQPPTIDVSVSERMGLFVVSHLAARHGMGVQLDTAPSGGIRATVSVPPVLLAPASAGQGSPVASRALADDDRTMVMPVLRDLHPSIPRRPGVAARRAALPATSPGPAQLESPSQPVEARNDDTTDLGAAATIAITAESGASAEPAQPIQAAQPSVPEPQASIATATQAARARQATTATEADEASVADGPQFDEGAGAAGWWSPEGSAWTAAWPESREPVTAGTNAAGLPVRVPQANGPDSRRPGAKTSPEAPAAMPPRSLLGGAAQADTPGEVVDPGEIATTLARFHGAIRQADDDDDPAACRSS
jgi:signal transduction histidine kinase